MRPCLIVLLGLIGCSWTPALATPYERAVAYELERDLEAALSRFARGQGLVASDIVIDVTPDLDTSTTEPWLRAIKVEVRLSGDQVDRDSAERLLTAQLVARGFRRNAGDQPQFTLDVSLLPAPQVSYAWWQTLMIIAFALLLVLFAILLRRTHSWRNLEPELRTWIAEPRWDASTLGLASAQQLRQLFRSIPINNAIHMLSTLGDEDRARVMDALRMQLAVRQRVEKRLERIRGNR